jgi:hypothetical protein
MSTNLISCAWVLLLNFIEQVYGEVDINSATRGKKILNMSFLYFPHKIPKYDLIILMKVALKLTANSKMKHLLLAHSLS